MIKLDFKKIGLFLVTYGHPILWDILYTNYQKYNGNIKFDVAINQNIEALIIITILGYIISYYFLKIRKINQKINELAFDHAMQINYIKALLASNNIKVCEFDYAKKELTIPEIKYLKFDEKVIINNENLHIGYIKTTNSKIINLKFLKLGKRDTINIKGAEIPHLLRFICPDLSPSSRKRQNQNIEGMGNASR